MSAMQNPPPTQTQLEVLGVLGLSTFVFTYQIFGTITGAFEALPRRRVINGSLLVHIFVGCLEIIRFYTRRLAGLQAHAESLDVAFMLIHVGTSLHLAKEKGKIGNSSITRPIYHSQALFRLLFTILAHTRGLPDLQKASVMINMSFIYPRLIIYVAARLRLFKTYGDIFTMAMFVSALLAMSDSGIRYGPQIWMIAFAGFVQLERRVAQRVVQRNKGSKEISVATDVISQWLYHAGFVETHTLNADGIPPTPIIKIPGW